MGTVRVFIAIEFSENVVEEISSIINKLRAEGDVIKWVKPENVHLTLKFLGNVQEKKIDEINEKLIAAAQLFHTFDTELRDLGAFPNLRDPKVIWLGIGPGKGNIQKIAGKIEKEMEILGFAKEKRQFKAHLTLGRVKHINNKKDFQERILSVQVNPVFSKISKICLFKSILTSKGSIYTKLSEYYLKN